MTSAPDPDDLDVVDELLAGMGSEDAEPLRPVLAELRSLAGDGPVLPNRRLAALLVDDAAPTAVLAAPLAAPLPTSQAAAELLADTRMVPAQESADATVVDLAAARSERASQGAPERRRRGRRPAVTALVIALAAGAATAAAAVAQGGLFPGPDHGTTGIERPATGGPSQAPSETTSQPESPISPRLAPAEQAPQGPSPNTAGPSQERTTAPQTSAPAPAGGPEVPLPSLPLPSAAPVMPTPAPTAPDLLPLPQPTGILPGGPLPLP